MSGSKRKFSFANNPLFSGPPLAERELGGSPYREIDIALIDPDPNQPRRVFDEGKLQELSDSIRQYGVLSPILVAPSQVPGRYRLVAGERRLRASQLAGRSSIPAMIDRVDEQGGESRTLAVQLIENLQRADLSPLERAQAIGALRDNFKLSIREIAEKLGLSKSLVQRSLDLLQLPPDLMDALRNGAAESKILILAKIEDAEVRASYLRGLDELTRVDLEKDVARRSREKEEIVESPDDARIAGELQSALGLKVRIVRSAGDKDQGRLYIEFYSERDLQEVFRKLVSENR